jgi:putative toxin-antitoxin system antitoxin component (TIGR02293 family)
MAKHALLLDVPAAGREPADVERFWKLSRDRNPSPNRYVALLGMKALKTDDLLKKVQDGFVFDVFEHLTKNIALPPRELAVVVQISSRTLDRRRERGRLEPAESDRILRVSRVFAAAIELFEGDAVAARRWMLQKQKALGEKRPLDLLGTELGARDVEALIGRLEHGVFS